MLTMAFALFFSLFLCPTFFHPVVRVNASGEVWYLIDFGGEGIFGICFCFAAGVMGVEGRQNCGVEEIHLIRDDRLVCLCTLAHILEISHAIRKGLGCQLLGQMQLGSLPASWQPMSLG